MIKENFCDFLLELCYQTFALKKSYFEYLSQKEWKNAGIENWVQIELITSMLTRNIPVTTIGKGRRDCDLIIQNRAVELRCATAPFSNWLLDAITKHPKAEYYLFLHRTDKKTESQLNAYFQKNKYSETSRILTENWVIRVVQKRGSTQSGLNSELIAKIPECRTASFPSDHNLEKLSHSSANKGAFYEKLGQVNSELEASFEEIIQLIDDLWKDAGRYEFPHPNCLDYRTPSSATVVSIHLQTRKNRLMLYLKFGAQEPNDPARLTSDVTRFGFGKLNRQLYFDPVKDRIGDLDEKGSFANLLKQVHDINQ